MQHLNNYGTKTSNNFNSFKYKSFDLYCNYSIPIRGILLTLHQSTRTVILQSYNTSLMRYNITCLLDLFSCLTRIVCFTSLINDYIVTCRVLLFLYCWRVRSFRFFYLTIKFNYYWVTIEDVSNCEGDEVNDLIDNDNFNSNLSSLVINLFIIIFISRLKLFIIA